MCEGETICRAAASPVREIARWVKGIGWTRAARPAEAAPRYADGKGGPMTHSGGNVAGEGTHKGEMTQ